MNSTVLSKSESAEPLPPIPAKRYFTIGEVSELCGVKPHVLRYWEQEFTQLRPMKRRGNRRYYQHHEVLLVRRIRDLLYEQGFTISGARNRLGEAAQNSRRRDSSPADNMADGAELDLQPSGAPASDLHPTDRSVDVAAVRADLLAALALLQIDNDRSS
jgi:DNA-binding transcriptional MerR regulator